MFPGCSSVRCPSTSRHVKSFHSVERFNWKLAKYSSYDWAWLKRVQGQRSQVNVKNFPRDAISLYLLVEGFRWNATKIFNISNIAEQILRSWVRGQGHTATVNSIIESSWNTGWILTKILYKKYLLYLEGALIGFKGERSKGHGHRNVYWRKQIDRRFAVKRGPSSFNVILFTKILSLQSNKFLVFLLRGRS